MITISLCMIVKNEENTLGRCLDSVADIVDEIIIVDTGSTDRTKEIASEYTSLVYDFEWTDDFSAARNYSFSKSTMDYILWLDADDEVLEQDRKKLKLLKHLMDYCIDVVMMKYNVGHDERGNANYTLTRERLLKRSRNFKWCEPVHECITFNGVILNTDICITHKKLHSATNRNLLILQKIMSKQKEPGTRNLFYYARELFNNGNYDDAAQYYNRFLQTEDGIISTYLQACMDMAKYYIIKNDRKNALKVLFKSFEYDSPRAEICCYIGCFYKDMEEYKKAIVWYDLATKLKKPENTWDAVLHDYWGYIPCIELCNCYYKLGNVEEAMKYNELAAQYKPDGEWVLENAEFFDGILEAAQEK